MKDWHISAAELTAYRQDGFFVVESLLDQEEVELLSKIARADQKLREQSASRDDGEGGAVKLSVSNEAGEDIFGTIVRSEAIVNGIEQLLEDEAYLFHYKMIQKEPFVGGAWAWHQDYGYWYDNGCLLPQLASCMIAVDRSTKENGCLQVIRGSHLMGRVNHGTVNTTVDGEEVRPQTGADLERVQVALERMEKVYCELSPGSAVIFHCNLLHRSDQNTSENPRWVFIGCYNAKGNDPYKQSRHPGYSPLVKCPNSAVKEVGRQQWEQLQQMSQ